MKKYKTVLVLLVLFVSLFTSCDMQTIDNTNLSNERFKYYNTSDGVTYAKDTKTGYVYVCIGIHGFCPLLNKDGVPSKEVPK